jgi:hypothetical protein
MFIIQSYVFPFLVRAVVLVMVLVLVPFGA